MMKTKVLIMSIFLVMMGVVNAALPVTGDLVMHLDAGQIVATDGDPVATWADVSGAGNDATQATAGAQPTFVAANPAFNDYATVSFDGTDDYLNLDGSIITVDNFTLFIVGNFDVINDGGQHYFISAQGGSGNDRLRVAHYSWGSGFMTRIGNTGDRNLGPINTDAAVIAVNGTASGWLNGGDKQTVGTNTAGALNPSHFALGCYNDAVTPRDFLTGDLAEVVLYNVILTDEQVAQTNEYLRLKYKPTQAASNPVPTDDGVNVTATLSWDAPEAYTGATYDVYFGTTEPNFNDPAPYGLSNTLATGTLLTTATPVPSPMAYETDYFWVVDTHEPNDIGTILHPGAAWSFTTEVADSPPVVTAGSDWVAWLDSGMVTQTVSGIVDDSGEGDVADTDIVWTIQAYPGGAPATAMQMIDRGSAGTLPAGETDIVLLRDWIGTDTRGTNIAGDPLTLTIGGLASGTYTLTTIHHDMGDQTGTFNIAIDGTTVATGVDITSGTESPITRHVETITSDGLTPIEVVFDLNERPEDPNAFFVMNGLEIEDTSSNVVKIDFGNNEANTSVDYEGYIATHENPDTFGPAYYALGSGYVSITPTWGQKSTFATVTKTNMGLASTADFMTTVDGTYTLRLTAADDTTGGNPIPQVAWDTLDVQVVQDACTAAQMDTANWTGFMNGDINEDCNVNIEDLADLATEWLLSNEAAGSVEL